MNRAPVELRVGGQSYRVVASSDEAELQRLAQVVDTRLRDLAGPGRALAPQSLLLVAMALAHDLETERVRRKEVEASSKQMLTEVLARIDALLNECDPATESAEPSHPPGP
ncbi:MAG: cell division protein ZapA [Polyangiaceae bacterium]